MLRLQRDLLLAVARTRDFSETLRLCLAAAIQASGMDCGGIYLRDDTGGFLLVSAHGLSEPFVESTRYAPPDSPNARLVMTGTPTYTRHANLAVSLSKRELREGLEGLALVPFQDDRGVIGCINVASHSAQDVPPERRLSLETIASVAGLLIGRAKNDDALRASEERYRAVVEDQTETICRFRADGTLTFVNDVYCRYFGKSADVLLGSRWQSLALAEDVRGIQTKLETLSPNDPVVVIENRVYDGNGESRWVQFVNRGRFDAAGRLVETQAVGRDVTERKQAESALRDANTAMKDLINNSPLAIVGLDPTGAVRLWNPAAEALFGWTRDEVLGRPVPIIPAEKVQEFRMLLNREMQGHQSRGVELSRRRKDGSYVDVNLWTAPMRDEQGRVVDVFGMFVDVTERKRSESALRRSEEQYRSLAENIGEVVYRADPQTLVATYVNQAVEGIYGYTPQEWLDDPSLWEKTIHPDDKKRVLAELKSKIKKDKHLNFCYRIIDKDGAIHWLEDRVVFERDEAGNVVALFGVVHDITDRTKNEQRVLGFSRQLLAAREDERRRLSTILHHDVGSLAVSVLARLGAAEEDLRAGLVQPALEALMDCRRLFNDSVSSLRSLAVEARPPCLDLVGLPAVLRQHVKTVAARTGLRIRLTDATHGSAIEPAVATVLFRILQEAINNVAKHAGAANVRGRLSVQGRDVRLTIVDDGCGFDSTVTAEGIRCGLGLTSMREMALSLGGSLLVESRPGHGTKIVATLPLGENP